MATPERLAYGEAWRKRRETGDGSPEVLLAELRTHEVDAVWTDPESELHAWLFDCWRRGVGPGRLPLAATRKAVSFLPAVVKPFREILRQFR